jgi:hypothetical protein
VDIGRSVTRHGSVNLKFSSNKKLKPNQGQSEMGCKVQNLPDLQNIRNENYVFVSLKGDKN